MKILYIHIPKTGGTSFENVLSNFKNTVITENHPMYKNHIEYRQNIGNVLNFNLSRAEHFRKVLGPEFYNNVWSIAIVRNPWDRYVSNWKWLTRESCKYNNYTKTNGVVTFDTFVKESVQCYNRNTMYYDHQKWHIRNQLEHITDKSKNIIVSHVGKFEDLENEFKNLCCKAKIDAQLPYLNYDGHYSGEQKKHEPKKIHYSQHYTQELVDIVARRCKEDIEFFKYDYEEIN